jgi:hypothetical protein
MLLILRIFIICVQNNKDCEIWVLDFKTEHRFLKL